MEIKTWADFGSLSKEALDAYTPEDLEALKTSIAENEAELVKGREAQSKKEKELADNYKIRAEKAEKKAKGEKIDNEPEKSPKTDGLSSRDAIAIAKANVHEDDVDELIELAQFKKISVSEALKHKTWKTISAERTEERQSAEVANTSKQKGAISKVTGETLIDRVRKGEAVDANDIDKIVEARMQKKINDLKS